MGLDIIAYRKLVEVRPFDEILDIDHNYDGTMFYINTYFPNTADTINEDMIYQFENTYSFCAGSYGGYGKWIAQLAELTGVISAQEYWHNADESEPFYNLINFSDCEGTLDCAVCTKLFKDFCDYEDKATELNDSYFMRLYANFKDAFEIASDNGAVKFC